MKTKILTAMQKIIEIESTNNRVARYRIHGLSPKSDPGVLGELYFAIERRVDSVKRPYIRDVFGEWMNFFEVSLSVDAIYPKELETLDHRIDQEALLSLLYSSSVIDEETIVKTWLNTMKEMGYEVYSVDIVGKGDHISSTIYVSNKEEVYVADITVNTK